MSALDQSSSVVGSTAPDKTFRPGTSPTGTSTTIPSSQMLSKCKKVNISRPNKVNQRERFYETVLNQVTYTPEARNVKL